MSQEEVEDQENVTAEIEETSRVKSELKCSDIPFSSLIAVVGRVGAGKSTLVQALTRAFVASNPWTQIVYVSQLGYWNDAARSAIAGASNKKRIVFVIDQGIHLSDLVKNAAFLEVCQRHRALQIGVIVTAFQPIEWPETIKALWEYTITLGRGYVATVQSGEDSFILPDRLGSLSE